MLFYKKEKFDPTSSNRLEETQADLESAKMSLFSAFPAEATFRLYS
jgi:hypothetical protein